MMAAGLILIAAAFLGRSRPHPPPDPSIIVLPFSNLNASSENDYFSDGLAAELTDELTRVERLRVVAWSTALHFKGSSYDVKSLGENLKVGAVLKGSVRKSGGRLRISAQLINTADGSEIWSQTYERRLKDVFAIQDEIARAIVNSLRTGLGVGRERLVAHHRTENLEAYDLYLKGRFYRNPSTPDGIRKSSEYFQQVIRADPNYAPAYAMLSANYALSGYYHLLPGSEAWSKAKEMASRAMEIDNTLAEAHTSLGFAYAFGDWDWSEAERELLLARELNPGSADVHSAYAIAFLAPVGRLAEAVREMKKAVELDPLSFLHSYSAAFVSLCDGRVPEAIERYRKAIGVFPDFPAAWWNLGMAYAYKGDDTAAMASFRKAGELREGAGWKPGAAELALVGRVAEARRLANEVKSHPQNALGGAVERARLFALAGDVDEAFAWLDRAWQAHDSELIWTKIDPRFANLRSDRRYGVLLARLDLPIGNEP